MWLKILWNIIFPYYQKRCPFAGRRAKKLLAIIYLNIRALRMRAVLLRIICEKRDF